MREGRGGHDQTGRILSAKGKKGDDGTGKIPEDFEKSPPDRFSTSPRLFLSLYGPLVLCSSPGRSFFSSQGGRGRGISKDFKGDPPLADHYGRDAQSLHGSIEGDCRASGIPSLD